MPRKEKDIMDVLHSSLKRESSDRSCSYLFTKGLMKGLNCSTRIDIAYPTHHSKYEPIQNIVQPIIYDNIPNFEPYIEYEDERLNCYGEIITCPDHNICSCNQKKLKELVNCINEIHDKNHVSNKKVLP